MGAFKPVEAFFEPFISFACYMPASAFIPLLILWAGVGEAQNGIWETDRKTVLFVTHNIDESIFMANRVVVMTARPGRIKCEVGIDLRHPRHYTMKTSPEFSGYKARITEEIRAEAVKAVRQT